MFVYLAAPDLSCGTQDLHCRVQESLVAGMQDLLVVACGIFFSCGMWSTSLTRDQTGRPALAVRSLNHWTTREVPPFSSVVFASLVGRQDSSCWHFVPQNVQVGCINDQYLCIAAATPCPLILWIQVATSNMCTRMCICWLQSPYDLRRKFFNVPLKFL